MIAALRLTLGTIPEQGLSIIEFGGGNSCFLDAIRAALPVRHYTIIDKNSAALELTKKRWSDPTVSVIEADILDSAEFPSADIVFSVGLVEHFDGAGTACALAAHLSACRPGGGVVVSYPTPTLLYRSIRAAAEAIGQWQFPDERPLTYDETRLTLESKATLLHRETIWMLGLTQELVALRKASELGG